MVTYVFFTQGYANVIIPSMNMVDLHYLRRFDEFYVSECGNYWSPCEFKGYKNRYKAHYFKDFGDFYGGEPEMVFRPKKKYR